MRRILITLFVLAALGCGLCVVGGCSSMKKSEVESRLLALAKNQPIREAGLRVKSGEAVIGGVRLPVEYRWHAAGTSGPVVVLVHGTPSSLVSWTEVVHGGPGYAGLAQSCRVLALDVVGHGTTRTELDAYSFQKCADWVAGFLDLLELTDVTLVGQSYGGEFAWRAALDRPERVSRVVLMSSSGFPRRDDEWLPEEVKMRELSLAKFGWLLNSRERLRPALDLHFAQPSPDERIEEYFLVCENSDNWRAMIDLARDENGARSGDLARLTQPCLLLWGERDVAYRPERFGQLFADTIPRARWSPVPGAGHYPHEEQPALVARAIAQFAQEGAR
ncbi:MAG: alpha/beta hydrolase [Planctomycetes bacterium]|nr:alpha/beta hydrolase [Planctomycetota bacterium]